MNPRNRFFQRIGNKKVISEKNDKAFYSNSSGDKNIDISTGSSLHILCCI